MTAVLCTIPSMALLDLLNPFTWFAHDRGERHLEIDEERLHAGRAANLHPLFRVEGRKGTRPLGQRYKDDPSGQFVLPI